MNKNNLNIMSINIDMGEIPVLSQAFRDFVAQDEMEGVKDLQLMLKDEKLAKRVPPEIKKEFEEITSTFSSRIEVALTSFIQQLEENRTHTHEQAAEILQNILDSEKKKDEVAIFHLIIPH